MTRVNVITVVMYPLSSFSFRWRRHGESSLFATSGLCDCFSRKLALSSLVGFGVGSSGVTVGMCR